MALGREGSARCCAVRTIPRGTSAVLGSARQEQTAAKFGRGLTNISHLAGQMSMRWERNFPCLFGNFSPWKSFSSTDAGWFFQQFLPSSTSISSSSAVLFLICVSSGSHLEVLSQQPTMVVALKLHLALLSHPSRQGWSWERAGMCSSLI